MRCVALSFFFFFFFFFCVVVLPSPLVLLPVVASHTIERNFARHSHARPQIRSVATSLRDRIQEAGQLLQQNRQMTELALEHMSSVLDKWYKGVRREKAMCVAGHRRLDTLRLSVCSICKQQAARVVLVWLLCSWFGWCLDRSVVRSWVWRVLAALVVVGTRRR